MRTESRTLLTRSSDTFGVSGPAPRTAQTDGQNRMMLRLNNIEVIYSDVILVLKGLSLEVPQGQIVALLGANGAGKTTTLKAISGLLKTENGRVTGGSVELMGRRIDGLDPERICRQGILQVMEGRKVLESLTVEENLRIGGDTRPDPDSGSHGFYMGYD